MRPCHDSHLARSLDNLAHTARDDIALGISIASVRGTRAQATLCESSPELTGVRATSQGSVGINDGITAGDEVRVTGLPVFHNISSSFLSVLLTHDIGWVGNTYKAIPSTTSFIARYRPSVGTPSESNVGWVASVIPYLSTKFQNTS